MGRWAASSRMRATAWSKPMSSTSTEALSAKAGAKACSILLMRRKPTATMWGKVEGVGADGGAGFIEDGAMLRSIVSQSKHAEPLNRGP
jgi:hypothetical protein